MSNSKHSSRNSEIDSTHCCRGGGVGQRSTSYMPDSVKTNNLKLQRYPPGVYANFKVGLLHHRQRFDT